MSFSKVKIEGSALPSAPFDFSHDFTGTLDWGTMSVTQCKLLPLAGIKSNCRNQFLVRLAPMPSATFGRIWLRQYHQFVPLTDIFKQFPHFLAQVQRLNDTDHLLQRVNQLPSISSDTLLWYLLKSGNAHNWYYKRTGSSILTNAWTNQSISSTVVGTAFFKAVTSANNVFRIGQSFEFSNSNYKFDPSYSDFKAYSHYQSDDVCLTSRLTRKGLRLYNAMLGAGYKPSWDSNLVVSALGLFAVYKAYWDCMHLPQFDNFEDSSLYRLIRYYDINGTDRIFSLSRGEESWMPALKALWDNFFDDLANMWYSSNVDFTSAHLPYNINMVEGDMTDLMNSQFMSGIQYETGKGDPQFIDATASAGLVPKTNNAWMSQLDDEYAKRLYYYVNKRSQIGYDLKNLLRIRGYGQFIDDVESRFLGRSSTQITVSELLSTSDTTDSNTTIDSEKGRKLGDYAGQASKFDQGNCFSFTNSEIGYQVSFATIVPDSRMDMALDGSLLGTTPLTFYSSQFDGFGYSSTPRACIGHEDAFTYITSQGDVNANIFGIKPRFMEWKVSNSIRSGLMSLRSQRNTWNSWHLDRIIYQNQNEDVQTTAWTSSTNSWKDNVDPSTPSSDIMPNATKEWRYPTKYGFLNNYDRIFYDGQFDFEHVFDSNDDEYPKDNFMIQMVFDYRARANMLPVSSSWETIECDDDPEHVFTVTK